METGELLNAVTYWTTETKKLRFRLCKIRLRTKPTIDLTAISLSALTDSLSFFEKKKQLAEVLTEPLFNFLALAFKVLKFSSPLAFI